MIKKICSLLVLCFGFIYFQESFAENEHELKKGIFPYMAFVFYADATILDSTGERFVRSAVIIREEWLLTSAMGPNFVNPTSGFPKKTLLARAGAVTFDANFTLNEDEDEQEREVIRIVRPYKYSATQWWTTDISLLKTLTAFTNTLVVGVKAVNLKRDFNETRCSILVYAKRPHNNTGDKTLMLLSVELLPPTIENCGSHFAADTMVCANDSENGTDTSHGADFCHGNSGGPLICDREVMGLQTYIENDCKQPHLYQLLSAWERFITCGIEDMCEEDQCANTCDVTHKDPPATTNTTEAEYTEVKLTNTTEAEYTEVKLVSAPAHTPDITEDDTSMRRSDTTTLLELLSEYPATRVTHTTEDYIHNTSPTADDDTQTTVDPVTRTSELSTQFSEISLPKETSTVPQRRSFDTDNEATNETESDIEAQTEPPIIIKKKKVRSAATRNMFVVNTVFFGLLALVCEF